ncbi:MAG: HPF/RaiA family ribosome-associated protein [Salibacteraceae bacterium]|jgi:putative sigma-54 modulation protein|nr:HPF/RaiA family ribosome-associated protein [Salibacteraceae bacterium]MDP4687156.1 HPF/RaiA family ribosome-associated protein [Salibacteraceae bacterium]MDP4763813.1 HPF/RaiA family ribosome-associated protein [Salibacteraceae bacterium]MDP4845267.1 HPF/RaiA family ribosome-associated protein [Salibacteraceae bacterium]MDP4935510.1 HPF/RaiA family ribosome-associated protein [Salibacteraceae bacterium]
MQLKVHSIHFDADIKLVNFIEQKINKLTLFYDDILTGEVFLRIDKSQDTANKVAEIRLLIPGKELFAKRRCKSFEEAADLATEALRRQVRKKKGKILQSH